MIEKLWVFVNSGAHEHLVCFISVAVLLSCSSQFPIPQPRTFCLSVLTSTLKPFITKKKKIGQNFDFPIKLPGMIIPKNKVYSELQQCKSLNSDLLTRIIQLESNTVTNSQYGRRETIELNTVPAEIHEDILEEIICKVLSLTGVNVVPENL